MPCCKCCDLPIILILIVSIFLINSGGYIRLCFVKPTQMKQSVERFFVTIVSQKVPAQSNGYLNLKVLITYLLVKRRFCVQKNNTEHIGLDSFDMFRFELRPLLKDKHRWLN